MNSVHRWITNLDSDAQILAKSYVLTFLCLNKYHYLDLPIEIIDFILNIVFEEYILYLSYNLNSIDVTKNNILFELVLVNNAPTRNKKSNYVVKVMKGTKFNLLQVACPPSPFSNTFNEKNIALCLRTFRPKSQTYNPQNLMTEYVVSTSKPLNPLNRFTYTIKAVPNPFQTLKIDF